MESSVSGVTGIMVVQYSIAAMDDAESAERTKNVVAYCYNKLSGMPVLCSVREAACVIGNNFVLPECLREIGPTPEENLPVADVHRRFSLCRSV